MFDSGQGRGGGGSAAAGTVTGHDRAAAKTLGLLDELVIQTGQVCGPLRASNGWSAGQRAAALRALDRLAGLLANARAGVVVAEQAAAATAVGDRDFVAARARSARTGLGAARRELRQAHTLVGLPVVARAVEAGRVPVAHLDALASATAHASERAAAALASPHDQERLVRWAERLSVREFGGAVARLVASYDPASLERGVAEQRASRFLTISHQPDGVHLRGRLDVLAGAKLRAALDGIGAAPDETRDKAQADADALVALAERATSGMAGIRPRRPRPAASRGRDDAHASSEAGAPSEAEAAREADDTADAERDAADARVTGAATRPVVSILVPAETFIEIRNAQRITVDAPAEAQSGRGPRGHTALAPATLEDGTPIALTQLAQALCDCRLGRVVLDADSVPLDLGRTTRLFSAAQRRAVIVRDRACAWNGCEVPAAYSEVHHIRWWDRDDGPSDFENAVLLCSHHHHVVHQHDLAVARVHPGVRPPGGPPYDHDGRRQRSVRDEPVRYEFRDRRDTIVSAPS